jgi:hypothetical protein
MTEAEIQTSLAKHRDRNAQLRQVLSERAVNFSQERPVDVHFWVWSQRDAAVLARDLFKQGFLVKLLSSASSPDDPSRWTVDAGARVAPERMLGDEFTERMIRLAAEHDAIYDGWGTEL